MLGRTGSCGIRQQVSNVLHRVARVQAQRLACTKNTGGGRNLSSQTTSRARLTAATTTGPRSTRQLATPTFF